MFFLLLLMFFVMLFLFVVVAVAMATGKVMPDAEALDRMIDKARAFHKITLQHSRGRTVGKSEMLMATTPYAADNSRKPAVTVRREQLKIERHVVLQQFITDGFFAGNQFCTWGCARQYISEHAPPPVREELLLLVDLTAADKTLPASPSRHRLPHNDT